MSTDRLILRFLMTGGHTPIRSHFEALAESQDLQAWLSNEFEIVLSPRADSADLDASHILRESAFNIIRAHSRANQPAASDCERLNHYAHPEPLTQMLGHDAQRQWDSPAPVVAALSTIARDAIDLLGSSDAQRTRECQNPNCELVFVDLSPPGQRRWCAMGRCGNLAKTKAYRERHRSTSPN